MPGKADPGAISIEPVSGGSIIAGVLALAWPKLRFHDSRAANSIELVAAPILKLATVGVDNLLEFLAIKRRGEGWSGEYSRRGAALKRRDKRCKACAGVLHRVG